jgi:N-acyl-D-amino-acid deacylase
MTATAYRWILLLAAIAISTACPRAFTEEPHTPAAGRADLKKQIAAALSRGLPVVEKAARSYPKHRDCFSCHHQTLPMLAMVSASPQKLQGDSKLLHDQAEFTHHSFQTLEHSMKEGRGVGGKGLTVGYGLWALELAGWKPDETTEAMVTYLLKTQEKDGCWTGQAKRPPLEESPLSATVLSVRGMKHYQTAAQRAAVETAIGKAARWLDAAPVKTQEDRVMRLWGLETPGTKPEARVSARAVVLSAQQEDGGWPQMDGMKSDAYATGQALYVLQAAGLKTSDAAYLRGIRFLLRTQCPDGSWLVVTRSRPVQTYFDNGDPHGKNQFISIPATSWALAALAVCRE